MLAETRTPIENKYLSPCGAYTRRDRSRWRQCRLFDTDMWVLLCLCRWLWANVTTSRHMLDLHQLKMNLINILRDSRFSDFRFFFFFYFRGSFFGSLCKRRTYKYHFVHTHNFRFSILVQIFAITSSAYFCVWHTHHTARYKFNETAAPNCEFTVVFRRLPSNVGRAVSTEFPLTHIALTARRQMKSICSGSRLLNEYRFHMRRQLMCRFRNILNSDDDSLANLFETILMQKWIWSHSEAAHIAEGPKN